MSRVLLGPIDFSCNEIVKGIELCFSSFKEQPVTFPQPSSQSSGCSFPVLWSRSSLFSCELLARPLECPPAAGRPWGVCFMNAPGTGDIACQMKRGALGSNMVKDFKMATAEC